MPSYAIAEATKAAAQEDKRHAVHQYFPSNRTQYPSLQEIAEACIGPDEIISEREAMRRLAKYGVINDPSFVCNGTTQAIVRMLNAFPVPLWRWDSYKEGTLRRFLPEPKPFVRSVFSPPEQLPREQRGLHAQIRALKQQVTGVDEVEFISVGKNHKLVVNKAKMPAAINAFRGTLPHGQVMPNQILEVDSDFELTCTGILEEISVNDAQDLIASLR